MTVPTLALSEKVAVPQLGYGVWQVPDEVARRTVGLALDAGYRHIDTARAYDNERGVGSALADHAVPREEVFVTTKLWNTDHDYDVALRALDASLDRLGLDCIDLYLIHWPVAGSERYLDAWRALIAARDAGRARAIGVSNFQPSHLARLVDETGVTPAINQIELHPHLQQSALRAFHAQHGIVTEAWSPLGQGKGLLDDPALAKIAAARGKSPAQVVLRWHIQLGNVAIPKSVTPARIAENIDVFDFELTADDMAAIAALDTGHRIGPDPDTMAWMG
jgi:diketogulonate reductase-like aldo/keto reductase